MKAQDVMTRNVATVKADTSVHDIAALMMEQHISGMLRWSRPPGWAFLSFQAFEQPCPVLADDGTIIGIASQSDLLHRAEVGTERKHKWWFRIFGDSDAAAREYAKAHGLRASDIMTRTLDRSVKTPNWGA
jgi:hypothetical protein